MKNKRIAGILSALLLLAVLTGCSMDSSSTKDDGVVTDKHDIIFENYEDGTYRGTYVDGNVNQIFVQFDIKDKKFENIKYRSLQYKGEDYLAEGATGVIADIAKQYAEAAEYLNGKDISAIHDLYNPENIVKDTDAVTGATLRTGKLISAIWDGLNRHPYKLAEK